MTVATTPTTTIAIAGISSKLAVRVAAAILQRPHVHLRGSCRDKTKLPADLQAHPRLHLVQTGPHDAAALRALVRGCDAVVCCYFADNATMLSAQKLLIDACEAESVPRYLASDYTADYLKLDYGDIWEKDLMKDVLKYLQGKQNVKGVHVLVGLFIETFLSFLSGWDARGRVFRFWGTGEERVWEITSYRTAAEYVAAVALDPTAVGFLKFLGDQKSMAEIADVMQSVYRMRPRLESLGTVAECNQRRLVDGQNDLAKLHAQASCFLLIGKPSLGEDLDNSRYPEVKPETIRDYLEARDIDNIVSSEFAITEK